jgi:hypothetical protein
MKSNPRAVSGGNQPPSAFEEISEKINVLYDEARGWLDGEPVANQGMADGISKLIAMIRDAEKEAEGLRKKEVAPFDEGKAEVQARFNPLIGNTKSVKGKTVLAVETAKKALQPWLEKIDREKREVETRLLAEAEEARKKANEAFVMSGSDDLAAREEAEKLSAEAKQADIAARKAVNDKAHAKSGAGRANTLRTTYRAEMQDPMLAASHYWKECRSEMIGFLQTLADADVRAGKREIPGIKVIEERKVV